jgi:predicted aldo/keto reductase-like oxidoreductase
VKIAAKMPIWMVQKSEDFDRFFEDQRRKLQTEKIDFYLLHGLDEMSWNQMNHLKILNWAEKKLAAGQIGHFGFSFHDSYVVFKKIINSYRDWTFCYIQYNYMDINHQAGTRGLKYAADKGLAVLVMGPIRGGRLSNNLPPSVVRLWQKAKIQRTPSEWALLWLWEHPEVSVVLGGMSSLQQVTENLNTADHSGPGVLTAEDLALFSKVRQAYHKLKLVPCTGCRYCMPCPNKVEIPRVFEFYNDSIMYDDQIIAVEFYLKDGFKPEERADQCRDCGLCVPRCPQKINIPEWLKKAHAHFTSGEKTKT